MNPRIQLLALCLATSLPTAMEAVDSKDYPAIDATLDQFTALHIDEQYRPMITACRGIFFASMYLRTGLIDKGAVVAIQNTSDSSHPHTIKINGDDCSMKFDYQVGSIIEYANALPPAKERIWTTKERVALIKVLHLSENLGLASNSVEFDLEHPDERLHGDLLMFYRIHLGTAFLDEKLLVKIDDRDLQVPLSFMSVNVGYGALPAAQPVNVATPAKALEAATAVASMSGGVRRKFNDHDVAEFAIDPKDSAVLEHVRWVHPNRFFEDADLGSLATPVKPAFVCRLVFKGGMIVLVASAYVDVVTGDVIGGNGQIVTSEQYGKEKAWISR